MPPERTGRRKNDEAYRQRREKNNNAVKRSRAKAKNNADKVAADIKKLTEENCSLIGKIEAYQKFLVDHIAGADVEELRQKCVDIDALISDSKSLVEKHKKLNE